MKSFDRLSVKLGVAFAAVALVGVLVVALVAGFTTRSNFDRYVEHVGAMEAMMGDGMMSGDSMATMMSSPRREFLDSQLTSLVVAGVLAAGVAVVLAVFLARRFSQPLQRLTAVAGMVAAGDLSQRVRPSGEDEIGQLGRAFNVMAESLAAAQAQRRDFLADIAHELRTPLSVLQAHVEAMQDGLAPADAEHLAVLHEETDALTRLVEDLRTLSLADSGRLELHLEPVDVEALARLLATELEALGSSRDVRIRVDRLGMPPPVIGDAARLRQVLANLLTNALRFAPDGSEVVVEVQEEPDGVVASVVDRGPGVPPEELPLLFERFHRVDRSRARATGGSGLGLAIARQLVEAHGGTIWAESRPGEGARFGFRLPAPSAAVDRPPAEPPLR